MDAVAFKVSSALDSFLPTSLIGIVLGYFRSPVAAMGYRWDRLVFVMSGPDIQCIGGDFAVQRSDGSAALINSDGVEEISSLQISGRNDVKAIYRLGSFAAIVGEDNEFKLLGTSSAVGVPSWHCMNVNCSNCPVVHTKDEKYCPPLTSELTQVEGICATRGAFAALKWNGTVVTWGLKSQGGDSSSVQRGLEGVKAIYSTLSAFAAVLQDGTVEAWGEPLGGGFIPSSVKERLKQVQSISSTAGAFAALLRDGTVETWGDEDGHMVASELTQVEALCATHSGFAALKQDGTVVTWGHQGGGGIAQVRGELKQVLSLCSAAYLFTAVRSDGCVVTWGDNRGEVSRVGLTDVVSIRGAAQAFAALRKDGTVVVWGYKGQGGGCIFGSASAVNSEIKHIAALSSTSFAFAALRSDDEKVIVWNWGMAKAALERTQKASVYIRAKENMMTVHCAVC